MYRDGHGEERGEEQSPTPQQEGAGLSAASSLSAQVQQWPFTETPDLELLVSGRPESGRCLFEFQLNGRDPAWRLNRKSYGSLLFEGNPAQFFRQHIAELTEVPDVGDRLRSKGAYFSEKLLPQDLRKTLTGLQGTARTLLVQADDAWIPWEMLRLGSSLESKSADGDFLCEAFAMTRWLRGFPFVTSLPLRQIFIVAPQDAGLPTSEEECAVLARLEKKGCRKVERLLARRRTVHEALRRGEADGWHFIGHGFHQENDPDLSCIELEEGEVLTPADLSGELKKMGEKNPLVFLNACSSGRAGLSLTGIGGWARHFLEADAGAFLGALWPIRDSHSTRFAEAFYSAFTTDTPMAEAVCAARKAVRSDDDPTWLAYTVFAHPLALCQKPARLHSSAMFPEIPTNAPPRPSLFVGRTRDLQTIKERLGAADDPAPLQVLTAVRGWPGVGKSTMAVALSHDPEVRSAFPDGILWASLGEDPDLLSELAGWGVLLESEELEKVANLREAVTCLRALLRDRRALLVLDDVWEPEQVQPIQSSCGEACALLVTTRQVGVTKTLQGHRDAVYTLDVLGQGDALELLAALAPEVVERYPEECRGLVRDLECLPLSLQVAGRQLDAEVRMGLDPRNLIRELGSSSLLRQAAPADRMDLERQVIPTVDALLRRSTDRLDPQTRERFRRLGGFAAKPATFRLDALGRVWEVEDPRPTVRVLIDRGLLEPVGDSRFQLHSLLVRHAASLGLEGRP